MAPSAQESIGGWSRDELTKRLDLLSDPQGVISALKGYVVDFRAHFLCLLKQNADFDPKPQDLLQLNEEFGRITRLFLTHIRSARFENAQALLMSRPDINFAASHECREEVMTKFRVFSGSAPKVADKLKTVFADFFPKERPAEVSFSPTDSSLIEITRFVRGPSEQVERELSLAFAKRDFRTCLRDGNIDGAKSAMEKFAGEDFVNDEESRSAAKAGYLAALTSGRGDDANWIVKIFAGAGVDFTVQPALMPHRKKSDVTRRIQGAEPTDLQKRFLRALAQADMGILEDLKLKGDESSLLGYETAVRSGYLNALKGGEFAAANQIIEEFGEGIDLLDETKEVYLQAVKICDNNLVSFTDNIRYVGRIPLEELIPVVEASFKLASSKKDFRKTAILERLFADVVDFSKITLITVSPTPPKPAPDVDQFGPTEARGADGQKSVSSASGAGQAAESSENAEVVFADELVDTVVELLNTGNIDGAFKAKKNLGQNPEAHYPKISEAVRCLFLDLLKSNSHNAIGICLQYPQVDYAKELRDAFMYHIQQGNILVAERLERQFKFEFEPFDAFAIDIQAGYRKCLEQNKEDDIASFERRYGAWACLSEIKAAFIQARTGSIDLTNLGHVQSRLLADDEQILKVLGMPENRDHALRIFSQLLNIGNPAASLYIYGLMESDADMLNTEIRNALIESLTASNKKRFISIFRTHPVVSGRVYFDLLREGLSICAESFLKYIPDDVVVGERESAGAACRGVIAALGQGRGDDAERIFDEYFDDEIRHLDGYHDAVRNGYYFLLINGDFDGAISFRRHFGTFTEFTGYAKAAFDYLKSHGKADLAQRMIQRFSGNLPD